MSNNSSSGSKRIRTPSLKVRTASPGSTPSKRKKPTANSSSTETTSLATAITVTSIEERVPAVVPVISHVTEVTTSAPSPVVNVADKDKESSDKIPIFKDRHFVHSSKEAAGPKRSRVWKNLKQIVAAEKLLPWHPDVATYSSIDAPPSFKPARKYSDISGLQANYRDPETKLRYSTAEEYSRVKLMPSDLVAGCLALRKANAPVP